MSKSDAQIVDDDVIAALEDAGSEKEKEIKEGVIKEEVSDNELETLRASLEKEREISRRKDDELREARRQRSETQTKLVDETTSRVQAEEVAISNAIAASVAEAERLENAIVTAQEAGEFLNAAKLTRQLASAQTKIDSWEQRKEQLDVWKESQKNVKPTQTIEYPRSQAWIASHPEFNTDPKFRNKVMAAHYQAQADGIVIDSDDYISYIDNAVTDKKQVEVVPDVSVKSKTAAATPPSRGNGNMGRNAGGEGNNRLTADEADIAVWTYPKLKPAEAYKKYYENKKRAQAEGKLA